MKGLLLKDFYIIRSSLYVMLLTFLFVGAGMAFLISPWVLIVIFTVSLSFQSAVTIQMDRSSQWNRFSVTLPVPRKMLVSSKYVMYLLLSLSGLAIGTVFSLACALFQNGVDPESLLLYGCLAVIVSLLPGSISIPCSFWLDEEKSIVGAILAYMITSAIVVAFIWSFKQLGILQGNAGLLLGSLAAVSILFFLLSWRICPGRISRKDL